MRCGLGAGKHVRCSPRPGRRTCCQRRDSPPLSRLGTLRPDQTCKYTAPAPGPAPHQRLMHDYSSPCAHVCISVHSCIVWGAGGRGAGLLYTDTGAVDIVDTSPKSVCGGVVVVGGVEHSLERPLPLYCIEQKVIDLFRTVPLGRALPAWTRTASVLDIDLLSKGRASIVDTGASSSKLGSEVGGQCCRPPPAEP